MLLIGPYGQVRLLTEASIVCGAFLITVFRDHEIQVIELLTQTALDEQLRLKLCDEAEFLDCAYSGAEYRLTVKHPELPSARVICDQPFVVGASQGIESEWLIFIENGELMIECFCSGETNIPEDYREMDISVTVPISITIT